MDRVKGINGTMIFSYYSEFYVIIYIVLVGIQVSESKVEVNGASIVEK